MHASFCSHNCNVLVDGLNLYLSCRLYEPISGGGPCQILSMLMMNVSEPVYISVIDTILNVDSSQ